MKKIVYIFVAFHVSLFTFHVIAQQPTQEWVRRYSGPTSERANGVSLRVDNSGNVFVLTNVNQGTSNSDFSILKYSPTGALLWERVYDSPGSINDNGVGLALDNGGSVYVTATNELNSNFHINTVKYNTDGVFQWDRVYNGGASADETYGIILDKTDNIVVYGYTSNGGVVSALTIKYNGNGDSLWVRKFAQISSNNTINDGVVDDSNNVYLAGRTGADYLILKYSSSGSQQWYVTYNSPQNYFDIGWCIAIDNNRNVYVVGTTAIPFRSSNNTLVKLNSNGLIQWSRIYVGIFGDSGGCQIPQGIVSTPDGASIYYTTSCSNNTGGGGYDIVTSRYDSQGDTQWVKRYGGGVNATANMPECIRLDSQDNIYIAGLAAYSATGDDYVVIKYLPNGLQHWVAGYNGPLVNGFDHAQDLFVDTSFNLYVTGSSSRQSNPILWDAATIKYSQPLDINVFSSEIPTDFMLFQNFPNPFNNSTVIRYTIPEKSYVKLDIYNLLGEEVRKITNSLQNEGNYIFYLDFDDLPSGIYFYRLLADGKQIGTKRMILIK
ncbi:MAG: T9SS type A sorting domain-containing protein [Ignavibacteria bacterium]|nr:T9SS type A sorting domain-containing protein [Ignavibacteria bacterium]